MRKDHPNYNYFYGDKSITRWLSAILDNIFVSFIIGLIYSFVYYMFGYGIDKLILFGIYCNLYMAYFIIMEAVWSRSLGKMICKLIVVDMNLKKISWQQSLIRNLLRVVEANPFMGGFMLGTAFIFFSPRGQRIGDMVAGTVIQVYYKD